MRSYILDNVKAVLPAETAECSVRIEDGYIREIGTDLSAAGAGRFDGEGAWLVPGFTDIHCDSLERAIAPRPGFAFPLDVAIPAYSRELATHGITSVFHCVAIADTGENRKFLRDRETAVRIIDSINCLKSGLSIKTNIHLRYEILDTESLPLVRELVMGGAVQMISFMDHTPGYGVFKDFEAYRHYAVRSGKSEQESREMFTSMNAMRENVDLDAVYDLMHEAVEHGVVVATHDDHTEEKVERAHSNGVSISEFPVNMESIHAARVRDMTTVFGAANLVRGGSHAGNVSAGDMVEQGFADIICSDYSPMSLLKGVFVASDRYSLPMHEVLTLFTANPALAGGSRNTGKIQEGFMGDFALVSEKKGYPEITHTFVDGVPVYQSCCSVNKAAVSCK